MSSIRSVCVIEAPSHLGLKPPYPGKEPGVNQLPKWLKNHGLYDQLGNPNAISTVPPAAYTSDIDPETGVRNADAIVDYSRLLAQAVQIPVSHHTFSLVLGGDCSILLGCLLGLPADGTYGLFFLDGHTDFAWPGLSQTGGAAGMDLALVTGHGPAKLITINGRTPYIPESNVWAVGNRDNDPAYIEAIESSSIHYRSLAQLRERGILNTVNDFLEQVNTSELDGFWIHFDVDVLNNALMPAVDSPQPDGLYYNELLPIVLTLLDSGLAVGMDITILDPELDPTGLYTRQFIDELAPIWQRLRS